MKEPLFRNSFIRDKSTANAITKIMILQTRLMKFVYVAAIISLVSEIAILIFKKGTPTPFYSMIFFTTYVITPLLFVLMCFGVRMHNVPKAGKSEEEFVFTDNEMVWTSAGKTYTFDIKNISVYYDGNDYILVIPSGKIPMIPAIKKDSFTLGDADGFTKFLKANGVRNLK